MLGHPIPHPLDHDLPLHCLPTHPSACLWSSASAPMTRSTLNAQGSTGLYTSLKDNSHPQRTLGSTGLPCLANSKDIQWLMMAYIYNKYVLLWWYYQFIVNSCNLFTHILQDSFISMFAPVQVKKNNNWVKYLAKTKYIILGLYWTGKTYQKILKQGKFEGFDGCDQPNNLTQIGLKWTIFLPLWPWNVKDDLIRL